LVSRPLAVPLPVLAPERQDARAELERATRTLAAAMGRPLPAHAVAAPDANAPVLDLHMAALLSVYGERSGAGEGQTSRKQLVARLLRREADWRLGPLERRGIAAQPEELDAAVAVCTLAGDMTKPRTAELLKATPWLAEETSGRRLELAAWLADCYPAPGGGCGPLRPDPVGEVLLARVLERQDLAAGDLVDRADPAEILRTMTVLVRTAVRHPEARQALWDTLGEAPRRARLGRAAIAALSHGLADERFAH